MRLVSITSKRESLADVDDPVVEVDFYADTNWIGAKTSSPYSLTWSNVVPGIYQLTAVAWDRGCDRVLMHSTKSRQW